MLEQLNQIKETRDSILKLRKDVAGIISIDMEGKILVRESEFKELATNNKYTVRKGYKDNSLLFYEAEVDGILFKTNSDSPLFEADLEVK